jgi:NAD(P)-dependent dehydrogenase (short-subunit alcohol dehydrogenase family)
LRFERVDEEDCMSEQLRFDGEVVIVTGAGGGLGRAYALELARRGASVVVNDIGGAADGRGSDQSPAAKVVGEIEALGGKAVASFDSVTSAEGGRAIVRAALDAWGRLDGVISNAGFLRDRSFLKLEQADIDAVLDVHLKASFNVCQPAFAAMKDSGRGGRMVLTSSGAGLFGNFGQANYSAGKSGLIGLARTLAQEGKKAGIAVNVVAPVAGTRLITGGAERTGDDPLAPHNVAPMAVYLMHRQCPANGEIYFATGGWYARVFTGLADGWVAAAGENTPEGLRANWAAVRDVSRYVEPAGAMVTAEIMARKLQIQL